MGSHPLHAPKTDLKSRDAMEAPVAVTGFATMRSSPFDSAGIATNNISHALATAAAANAAARSAWQGMPPAGGSRMSTPYFTPQEFDLGPDEVDRRVAAAAAAARELGARDSFSESEASYHTAVGMPSQQSNSSVRLPSMQAFDLNLGSRGGAVHSGGAGGLSWSPCSSVAGYHTAGSTGAYSAQSTGGSTGAHTPGQGRRLSDLETVLEH